MFDQQKQEEDEKGIYDKKIVDQLDVPLEVLEYEMPI